MVRWIRWRNHRWKYVTQSFSFIICLDFVFDRFHDGQIFLCTFPKAHAPTADVENRFSLFFCVEHFVLRWMTGIWSDQMQTMKFNFASRILWQLQLSIEHRGRGRPKQIAPVSTCWTSILIRWQSRRKQRSRSERKKMQSLEILKVFCRTFRMGISTLSFSMHWVLYMYSVWVPQTKHARALWNAFWLRSV